MARHRAAMVEFQRRGAIVFDYGNNLRQRAYDAGVSDAFSYPGFVPAYVRPLFCEGKGPFRWVALSGDPQDIRVTDEAVLELFPNDAICGAGSAWPRSGCSSRGCRRASAGWATANATRPGQFVIRHL